MFVFKGASSTSYLEYAFVIGNSSHDNDSAVLSQFRLSGYTGHGDSRPVLPGHEQSP